MRSPGVVYVDGENHTQYDGIELPVNWKMVKWVDVGGIGNLAGSKNYIFENYPDERVYGWIADDNIPITPGWCEMVEDAACPWNLVHCKDEFISLSSSGRDALKETRNLGGGICWGGELIRCVGWWAPPGIIQASIDWAWTSLLGCTGIGIYREDITVLHNNWRTGRREKDANDDTIIDGKKPPHVLKDISRVAGWRKSDDFKQTRERLLREYNQRTKC